MVVWRAGWLVLMLLCAAHAAGAAERLLTRPVAESGRTQFPYFAFHAGRDGLLWFSRADGVQLFDGEQFIALNSVLTGGDTAPGLMFTLSADADDQIWMAGSDGALFAFDPRQRRLTDHSAALLGKGPGPGRLLQSLWLDERYLLLLSDSQLLAFDRQQPGSSRLLLPPGRHSARGRLLRIGAQGWLLQADGSLHRIYRDDNGLHLTPVRSGLLTAAQTPDGRLLLLDQQGQLFLHDGRLEAALGVKLDLAADEVVVDLKFRNAGQALLQTLHRLYQLELTTPASARAVEVGADQQALAINSLTLLGASAGGDFWFSYNDGQLLRLPDSSPARLLVGDGSSNLVSGLAPTTGDAVLVAIGGKLMHFQPQTASLTALAGDDPRRPGFPLLRLQAQGRDHFWLMGEYQLQQVRDGHAGPLHDLRPAAGAMSRPVAVQDTGTALMVATLNAGLLRVAADGSMLADPVAAAGVTGIAALGDRHLLMYGLGLGLQLFDTAGRALATRSPPLPTREIFSHQYDSNQQLWLLTGDGMLQVTLAPGGQLQVEPHVTAGNGERHAMFCWLELEHGQFFAATSRGLFRYQPATRRLTPLPRHPVLELPAAPDACMRLLDGRILLGTRAGLVVLDPVPPPADARQLVLRSIEQGDQQQQLFDTRLPAAIETPYARRYLNLRFAVLPVADPQQLRYQFALDGLPWQDYGRRSEIQLGQVDVGRHRLQVRALAADGSWQTAALTVPFTVQPPFWRHPLAYTLYALLLAGLLIQGWRIQRWKVRTLKRHVSALQASEQRLLSALWASRNSYWELDVSQAVWQRSALDFLDHPPSRYARTGRDDLQPLVHPADWPRVQAHWQSLLDAACPDAFEIAYRLQDHGGEWHWVQERGRIVRRNASHRPQAYAGTLHDIHAQKLLEQELREFGEELELRVTVRTRELQAVNRELEAFTASVTHDLKAPLRRMNAFLDLLHEEHGSELTGGAATLLERARAQGLQMRQLIDDLLRLATLSRQGLKMESVDLSALAQELCEQLAPQYRHTHYRIDIAPGMQVQADAGLMRALLQNLIDNALKYSQYVAQPQISIGTQQVGACLAYVVRDNGAGFERQSAGELFGMFRRYHSGPQFAGTGVGLSTARRIVERHHGEIWLDSSPGQGTRASFTLNCHCRHEAPASAGPVADAAPVQNGGAG